MKLYYYEYETVDVFSYIMMGTVLNYGFIVDSPVGVTDHWSESDCDSYDRLEQFIKRMKKKAINNSFNIVELK